MSERDRTAVLRALLGRDGEREIAAVLERTRGMALQVVVAADLDELERAIRAQCGESADVPPGRWTAGAALPLAEGLPPGFFVDLHALQPEVRYVALFLAPMKEGPFYDD